jgi:hypothetical protein
MRDEKRMLAATLVRSITEDETECDEVDGFTKNPAQNQRQDDIAAKLSVTSPTFSIHRVERISIPRSLTDGRVSCASDNSATSHMLAIRYDVWVNRSA